MKIDTLQNTKYSFGNQDLLSGLSDDITKTIAANRITCSFVAGQPIFKEGDEPKGIYRVLKARSKNSQPLTSELSIFFISARKMNI